MRELRLGRNQKAPSPFSWVSAAVSFGRAVTQTVVSAKFTMGLKPSQAPENSRQMPLGQQGLDAASGGRHKGRS